MAATAMVRIVMNTLIQILISGLVTGAIYGMIAIGFTIVFNATRIINFAHGEFAMVGGLIAAVLIDHRTPMAVALPCAILIAVLLGIVLERLTAAGRSRSVLSQAMVTIGVGIAYRGLASALLDKDVHFSPPFGLLPTWTIGAVYIPAQGLWIISTLALLSIGLWVLFNRTLLGKAMSAASENPRAAELCAISPAKMSMLAFSLAAGLGAVAGVEVAPMASAYYQNGLFLGLKGFSAAVLGGINNPLGAIVGGLILGGVENLSAGYIASAYKDAIAFTLLLILLLVWPSGLLGRVDVKRV